MSTTADATRDFAAIEADIARTRASLNRRLQELEYRLSPSERLAQVKSDLQRFDPRPYPEWIAVGAVVTGAALALLGWSRSRNGALHAGAMDDLEDVVIFEVCDDDLESVR